MDVPQKANRILNYVLLAFLLIAIRVWFLTIVQHDMHVEISKRPQQRTIVTKAPRGTIRDRFNIPLAINRVHYEAGVCYDLIREIPRVYWKNKKRTYPRKIYIERLSALLARELGLNPTNVEDIIHSKASLFPNTPFILKKGISEETYYNIKGMTKDWPGLIAQLGSHRYYPKGKLAAQLLGRLGKIDYGSYHSIANEIKILQEYLDKREEGKPVFLPENYTSVHEVITKLSSLKEKTYQFDDQIGRSGVEKSFERKLRGRPGKHSFLVDIKGHLLHRHPGGRSSIPGQRLLLTISAEMQDLAEKLLAENEQIRDARFPLFSKKHNTLTAPWIKGGAIVVMEPKSGEVLAFASHPRYNPNDFIRNTKISQWLESPRYIGSIWDGQIKLEREIFSFTKNSYETERATLCWEKYLDFVLSRNGTTRFAIDKVRTIGTASMVLHNFASLLDLSEQASPTALIRTLYSKDPLSALENSIVESLAQHSEIVSLLQQSIDPFLKPITRLDDKLLFLDLLKLCVGTKSLPKPLHDNTLQTHRSMTQALAIIRSEIKREAETLFERTDFLDWREKHFATYLKQKRKSEKERKTYQRPYIEYLDKMKRELFISFWKEHGTQIITDCLLDELQDKYTIFLSNCANENMKLIRNYLEPLSTKEVHATLKEMQSFIDLNEPLFGSYPRFGKKCATTKDLATAFYPQNGFGFGKSYAHSEATPFGSIYKLVTAYEAVRQHAKTSSSNLNPLKIIDEFDLHSKTPQGIILGYTADGKKITRRYNGGRLPKSSSRIGKVDLPIALERSSNVYFSLLASEVIEHPQDLITATENFGFGSRTGITLPREYQGLVPHDVCEDKSALYALAIGQHSLLATPLQAASFFSTLANYGKRMKPQILHLSVHSEPKRGKTEHITHSLKQVGLHYPFFLSDDIKDDPFHIEIVHPEQQRKIALPKEQRAYLFDAMKRVFTGTRGSARPNAVRYLWGKPKVTRSYLEIKEDLIGKTSTAEFAYRPTLDKEAPPILGTHTWFGTLSFKPQKSPIADPYREPELAVMVYLQHGDWGKEGAPLAAQLIAKWREIKKREDL